MRQHSVNTVAWRNRRLLHRLINSPHVCFRDSDATLSRMWCQARPCGLANITQKIRESLAQVVTCLQKDDAVNIRVKRGWCSITNRALETVWGDESRICFNVSNPFTVVHPSCIFGVWERLDCCDVDGSRKQLNFGKHIGAYLRING
jgi:hypothetical protein